MNLRVAIIGCGAIADGHADEIAKLAGVEVVATCDRERAMAQQLAERYHVGSVYDDAARMLEGAGPDVVHITTPPQSHRELAHQAMAAGCHVYVEKPVALNLTDTRALIDDARRRGVTLTAGHIYQFDPPMLALRELVTAGVLGDVTHIDSHFGYNIEGAFGSAIMGSASHWVHGLPGGLIHNNISHALAKAVEFFGDGAPEVHAVALRRSRRGYCDVRDNVHDELRTILSRDGVTAYVTFSAGARPVLHFARVYGTRNTAHVNLVSRSVTLERPPRLPASIGRALAPFAQGWESHREGWKNIYRFMRARYHFYAGMNELLRRFYHAVRTDGPPPISYEEILTIAAITDEIVAGMQRGQPR